MFRAPRSTTQEEDSRARKGARVKQRGVEGTSRAPPFFSSSPPPPLSAPERMGPMRTGSGNDLPVRRKRDRGRRRRGAVPDD